MTEEQYLIIIGYLKELNDKIDRIEAKKSLTDMTITEEQSLQRPSIKIFAEKLDLEESKFYDIIHFNDNNQFHLLFSITGKNESEKQLRGTLCFLAVSNYCNGKNSILSKELVKILESMKIKSLDNISHTLKKYNKYIIPTGKTGDPNFSYIITQPGLKEGIRIIKELIKQFKEDYNNE